MNRPTRITLIALMILLFLGSSVYAWRSYSNKQKLKALQTEMAAAVASGQGFRGPGSNEGRERFREIREQVEAMPASYQQAFRQSMGQMFRSREEQRMDEFFKLSRADRIKELDKRIAESEKRRKERQQRQNNQQARAGDNGGPPGGPNGGNGPGGNRAGGPGGNGGPRGGGFGGNLDRTTPEFRAKQAEYRREMDQRRAQLGLQPSGRR